MQGRRGFEPDEASEAPAVEEQSASQRQGSARGLGGSRAMRYPQAINRAAEPCDPRGLSATLLESDRSEDLRLLRAARRGDQEAFAALLAKHGRMVHGYLRARLSSAADAEDLAQEVFLRLYAVKRLPKPDRRAGLAPWLIGVARNVLREHARRRGRREAAWITLCLEAAAEPVMEPAAPEGPLEQAAAHLPSCLDSLGPSARGAVDLYYRDNLRLAEIADRFQRTEGAVKLLVFRARQAIRRCLDRRLGNDADSQPGGPDD